MNRKFKHFVGIDVSKKKLDFCLRDGQGAILDQFVISSSKSGLKKGRSILNKALGKQWDEVLFCLEHTGIYCRPFLKFADENKLNVWLQPALEIKRSVGMTRGKDDRIDAERIAEYAFRFQDKARLWEDEGKSIRELRELIALRARLKKVMVQLTVPLGEFKSMELKTEEKIHREGCKATIKALALEIKQAEKQINELLDDDPEISEKAKLIRSVPGIGMVTAAELIIHTRAFTTFDNARQAASYCGVAPFPNASGGFQGRNRVSNLANKSLKKSLHMGAMAASHNDPELKAYFARKVAEGKNKMLVLNSIRNKLLRRVFAVIKRGTPFKADYNPTKDNFVTTIGI